MHPPSLYSYVTSRKFIPLLVVIILVLGAIFYGLATQTPKINIQALVPSPTPITVDLNQQYVASNNAYSIKYPSSWKKIDGTNGDVGVFDFTDAQKQYRFTVSPPGQINPEGVLNVTMQDSVVTYGGKLYARQVWYQQGVPFYVVAIPKDIVANPHFFSMGLPAQNTESYLTIFGQIVASLSY